MAERKECRVHKLIADIAVLGGRKVLFVKYKDVRMYDNQRGWFLPDDTLLHLEHPNHGAERILKDQVGLTLPALRLNHIESFGDGWWHLTFHYRADLAASPTLKPGRNVATATWFSIDDLPERSEMAHHGWALDVLDDILAQKP